MHVFEYMTRNVYCTGPNATLAVVTKVLVERKATGCPVVDEQGKLIGIVTLTDIAVDGIAQPEGHLQRPVHQIMQRRVHRISHSAVVSTAVEMFREHRIHRLVVVTDGDHVAGILSCVDLLAAILSKTGYPPGVI